MSRSWKRALGLSRKSSVVPLFVLSGIPPIRFTQKKIMIRYLGYLNKLDMDTLASAAMHESRHRATLYQSTHQLRARLALAALPIPVRMVEGDTGIGSEDWVERVLRPVDDVGAQGK